MSEDDFNEDDGPPPGFAPVGSRPLSVGRSKKKIVTAWSAVGLVVVGATWFGVDKLVENARRDGAEKQRRADNVQLENYANARDTKDSNLENQCAIQGNQKYLQGLKAGEENCTTHGKSQHNQRDSLRPTDRSKENKPATKKAKNALPALPVQPASKEPERVAPTLAEMAAAINSSDTTKVTVATSNTDTSISVPNGSSFSNNDSRPVQVVDQRVLVPYDNGTYYESGRGINILGFLYNRKKVEVKVIKEGDEGWKKHPEPKPKPHPIEVKDDKGFQPVSGKTEKQLTAGYKGFTSTGSVTNGNRSEYVKASDKNSGRQKISSGGVKRAGASGRPTGVGRSIGGGRAPR